MGAEAVGAVLHEPRPLAAPDRRGRPPGSGLHLHHVHAIDHLGGDAVALGMPMDVGFGFRALQRRTHGVAVVLADEQDGELPQRGEIEGLVEFAFCRRAFAEEAAGDSITTLHLVRERQSDRERQSAADDGVTAIETALGVEDMHRAATTAARSRGLAVHLGHNLGRRQAAGERMAVFAIGCDNGVIRNKRLHDADCIRLLADVKMQETADLSG